MDELDGACSTAMYSLLAVVLPDCEEDIAIHCGDDWSTHLNSCLSDNYKLLSTSCKTQVLLSNIFDIFTGDIF